MLHRREGWSSRSTWSMCLSKLYRRSTKPSVTAPWRSTCWRRRCCIHGRGDIIERAATLRLPAIYQWVESAEEGGLVAYGPRIHQLYRQMARQLAKVLRGTKPGDLPVEQPSAFELVINLKTAKEIGHEIPGVLVLRADAVIE